MPDNNFKNAFPLLLEKIVLNVDDNEMNQFVMEQIMKNAGMKTIPAFNGAEAIEKLNNGLKPDFILMDLEMPVMTGVEAVEIIKNKIGSDIPIIINSGYISDVEKWRLKRMGIVDYLQKPYNMMDIFQTFSAKLVMLHG